MSLSMPASGASADQLGPLNQALVVIDFDGTLSPIVDRPEEAAPADGAIEALQALTEHTDVAVVSGRPLEELLERLPTQALTFVGGHGAQIQTPDGTRHHLVDPSTLAATLDAAESEVSGLVDDGVGWLVERKLASLAIHHRLVPEDEEAALLPRVHAVLDAHQELAPGFEVLQGKAVLELRPRGVNKGRALTWLLERLPGRVPVVFGDDETDEDAFVVAIEAGGRAVLVATDDRPSAARLRLSDPDEVVRTLRTWATNG